MTVCAVFNVFNMFSQRFSPLGKLKITHMRNGYNPPKCEFLHKPLLAVALDKIGFCSLAKEAQATVVQGIKCLEASLPPQKNSLRIAQVRKMTTEDIASRFETNGHPIWADVIRKQVANISL